MQLAVIGRRDNASGIGHHAVTFNQSLREFGNLTFHGFRIPRSTADLMIYTDVLWNGRNDRKIKKFSDQNAPVKMAYVVFDSNEAPAEWVKIINDSIDAVIVPTTYLVGVLEASGVNKPIFTVPLGLDLKSLLANRRHRLPVGNARPLRFGFVGAYHPRKRIDRLITCFVEAFGTNRDQAQLLVHSNVGLDPEFDKIKRLLRNLNCVNVTLSRENLETEVYEDLISSFDGFISVSAGEGFNIPARQALAAGVPLLLSDHTAHGELIESGLAESIAARIPRPAYYPEIDKRYFGLQYDVSINESALRLREFAESIRSGESKARDQKSRTYCEGLDFEKSRYRLYGLSNFGAITKAPNNQITSYGINTNDDRLYDKVSTARRNLPQKRLVYVAHDGGFFSVFNVFLSNLVWNQGKNGVTHVLPDWRISSMQKFFGTDKFTSFCYGRPQDGNIWLKLFEPIYDDIDATDYSDDTLLYRNSAGPMHSFNGGKEPLLTYIHAYELYRRRDFQEWRVWYNEYLRRYIRPVDAITRAVDRIWERMGDNYVIGMHVRHPSHAMEQPGKSIAGFDKFIFAARKILADKKHSIGDKWKIFLATDQDRVVNYFAKEFGDRLITVSEVARTTVVQDATFDSLDASDKLKEGFQIQHLMASDPNSWNSRLAQEVIVDALLLSRCNSFVHTVSNVATAVAILNPNVEMIYCD